MREVAQSGLKTLAGNSCYSRSLSDLFRGCVVARKVRVQGARSAVWRVQMSDEPTLILTFARKEKERSLPLPLGREGRGEGLLPQTRFIWPQLH